MSELQLALIGFGFLFVAAVWAYNAWQSKKHRQRAEAMLPRAEADDVLMAGRESVAAAPVRSEPGLDDSAVPPGPREPTFSVREEPEVEVDVGDNDDVSAQSSVIPLPAEWADGVVDCLLRVEFVDAVPVAALWAEQANWSGAVGKPMQWLGLDPRSERWRTLLPQDPGSITQLAVALQLVDRRGPLSESALGTFLGGVHQLAQKHAGLVELPGQAPVLARARELDAFCAGIDLQLTLQVVPRDGSLSEMLGARLQPLIEASGMRSEGERFVAVDGDGIEVFALVCHSSSGNVADKLEQCGIGALALSIDVPRVADGIAGFDRMLDFGKRCAEALGGQLVDPHRKPLAETTIAAIRKRIGELQGQMVQAGFPPGSVRALRLFS